MNKRPTLVLIAVMSLLTWLSLTGCNKKSSPPEAAPVVVQEPDIEHSVKYSGETLAVIAKWYTGRATNWNAIRDANPGLRPERINLGQVIMIPRALVVEERPMPREFVKSVTATKSGSKETEASPADTAPTATSSVDSGEAKSSAPAEVTATDPAPGADLTQPEATKTDTVLDTAPSSSSAPAATDDKEREKLLDELLQQ